MNGGVTGGIAAGIAQGILQKKARDRALAEQERQAELAKPMQELKKQLLQLQIANQKTQQARAATQNKFLDMMLQRMQGGGATQGAPAESGGMAIGEPAIATEGPQTTPIRGIGTGGLPIGQQPVGGSGSASNGGVVDMMAGMDPTMMAFAGKAMGTDLLGAGRLAEQRRRNQLMEEQYIPEEYVDPTGAKRRRYRKKYGLPPSLSMQQGELVAPAPVETRTYEKGGKTFEVIREKQTGKEITTPKEIKPIKGESSETASKISLAKNAIDYVGQLNTMFVNQDGSINKSLILSANAPMGGIGQGRTARAIFLDALDARARAATGAQMPESEIKNYDRMYWPGPLDKDELVKDKMKRLDSFMRDYLQIMDPTGRITESISEEPDLQTRYNKLRQSGLTEEQAKRKLGLTK